MNISQYITGLDLMFLCVLLASMLIGLWRGLVYEVLSVLGWVAAFILAQMFAPQASVLLPMSGAAEPVRYAAAFVIIFISVAFVAGIITYMIKRATMASGLSRVDRTLGAIFGFGRGVLILMAVVVAVSMTPAKTNGLWTESKIVAVLTNGLNQLKPLLPQEFAKYIVTS